ncbi:hypothetical protein D1816_24510 [Aquimarina sp. AD10]|uniref:hypothetical protein n=1 Tax=Aquimarina sp. AD10 TaxID=1714849 RepID=UPI000E4833B2|nr:hypothetical protein [Aquimarina sp. AD10]AXT63370.1 hypothetical protein D1816_24510 [Aquimarina sp. AD10]RKN00617.1 hypothetical protein D7033_07185 [Aquimarina sp. AD10]
MKKSVKIIFLILLICVSCTNSDKQKSTTKEKRYLCGFSNDSLKIRTEYTLTKTITDSIIKFDYSSHTDSLRDFNVEFKKHKNKLVFTQNEYEKSEINRFKNNRISIKHFDSYTFIKPEIDGMSPVLFNENYGVLAIGNPLGPSAIFLKKKEEFELGDKILDKL